jgi:hypothetical protein
LKYEAAVAYNFTSSQQFANVWKVVKRKDLKKGECRVLCGCVNQLIHLLNSNLPSQKPTIETKP